MENSLLLISPDHPSGISVVETLLCSYLAKMIFFDLFWGSTLNNHIVPDHLRPPIVVNEGDMVFDNIIGVPVSHHYVPVGSRSRAE